MNEPSSPVAASDRSSERLACLYADRLDDEDVDNSQRLRPCSGAFRSQYGLACSHQIKQLIETQGTLKKEDIHPR